MGRTKTKTKTKKKTKGKKVGRPPSGPLRAPNPYIFKRTISQILTLDPTNTPRS